MEVEPNHQSFNQREKSSQKWKNFIKNCSPKINPSNCFISQNRLVRISILTKSCVRVEINSKKDVFIEQPSQIILNRNLNSAFKFEISTSQNEEGCKFQTECLELEYYPKKGANSLDIYLQIKFMDASDLNSHFATWTFNPNNLKKHSKQNSSNLGGTTRTLDRTNGNIALEDGLLDKCGYTILNDSSCLFEENGFFQARSQLEDEYDIYIFGYGTNYFQVLRDYILLSGPVPLVPRFALGVWWSKYWEYNEETFKELILDFEKYQLPLSVASLDMDWHITVSPVNSSMAWTGYTWNETLFPNPKGLLNWVHSKNIYICLNLHPAEGCATYEKGYKEFASFMNNSNNASIPFKLEDPKFAEGYFLYLHHPHEEIGVDFWWIDYQQSKTCSIPKLDPLFALNHLHFVDHANTNRRPFILSRFAELGSHRYVCGFSGDTHGTWESLQFLPYFTLTASNCCFTWWSHDVGGFCHSTRDPELFVRWLQFALFSPIFRLHSMKYESEERRPWKYGLPTLVLSQKIFRLRYSFIPYIYSSAWKYRSIGSTLVFPMYYFYPTNESAYICSKQYFFGSELIASPIVFPIDPKTRVARQVVWIPEGDWFSFWNGTKIESDCWQSIFCELEEIPLFAKVGAIIPLASNSKDTQLPSSFEIHIFVGANNEFILYEDDGYSTNYLEPSGHVFRKFTQKWNEETKEFRIEKTELNENQTEPNYLPKERTFTLYFKGWHNQGNLQIQTCKMNETTLQPKTSFDKETNSFIIHDVVLKSSDTLVVSFTSEKKNFDRNALLIKNLKHYVKRFDLQNDFKEDYFEYLDIGAYNPQNLNFQNYLLLFSDPSQLRLLTEMIFKCGAERFVPNGVYEDEYIVLWNPNKYQEFQYRELLESTLNKNIPFVPVPTLKIFTFKNDWKSKMFALIQVQFQAGNQVLFSYQIEVGKVPQKHSNSIL